MMCTIMRMMHWLYGFDHDTAGLNVGIRSLHAEVSQLGTVLHDHRDDDHAAKGL
jgi:hypothetical protein